EADHLLLVTEQLAREHDRRDAALGTGDELERQADDVGERRERALPLLRAERGAADEELRVVTAGELLRASHARGGRSPACESARAPVKGGAWGHRRQQVSPLHSSVVVAGEPGQLERRRDQDRTV